MIFGTVEDIRSHSDSYGVIVCLAKRRQSGGGGVGGGGGGGAVRYLCYASDSGDDSSARRVKLSAPHKTIYTSN